MSLPDLPKQNKNAEAQFGIEFRHWMIEHGEAFPSCSFELKHTRGALSLPFDALTTEQVAYASKISKNGALVRVQGLSGGEPDYLWMRQAPAFIVVRFPDMFAVISADDFVHERVTCGRKSLTDEMARRIAQCVVEL